ncbi:MAG: phosphoribosyltransferase family protein [Candidatus Thorarchaeota archaeon]
MSIDFVLASGAEHLKQSLLDRGFKVYTSDTNHDGKRFFPNSDIYVRLSDVSKLSNENVVVIQSCTGSSPDEEETFTTADRVQELMLILSILRNPINVKKTGHKKYETNELKPPARIEVVLTLQPYALQDKPFKTGETASSFHATRAIADACDRLWLVSPIVTKDTDWAAQMSEMGKYSEIDIVKEIVDFGASKFEFDEYVIVAPDEGAQNRFGVPGLRKQRTDSFTIELSGQLEVRGKNVIVIDDLTKTGGTLLQSREILLEQGAKDVGLIVLHVTPIKDDGERLLEELIVRSEQKVVTSNTVYSSTFIDRHRDLTFDIVSKVIETLKKIS